MVQAIDLCIGGVSTVLGAFLIKRYYGRYTWMKQKTEEVKKIAEDSKKSLQFDDNLKKKKTQGILIQLTPHYTQPPKINSKLRSVSFDHGFKTNVYGQNFVVVNRGGNNWTKVRASLKKTKISSSVLVDRKFDGKSTDSETFSRARQLAIMGVVGYDLTKKEFYIDAEFIGESASQIIGYFEKKQTTEIVKIVFSSILVFVGGYYVYSSFKRRQQDV